MKPWKLNRPPRLCSYTNNQIWTYLVSVIVLPHHVEHTLTRQFKSSCDQYRLAIWRPFSLIKFPLHFRSCFSKDWLWHTSAFKIVIEYRVNNYLCLKRVENTGVIVKSLLFKWLICTSQRVLKITFWISQIHKNWFHNRLIFPESLFLCYEAVFPVHIRMILSLHSPLLNYTFYFKFLTIPSGFFCFKDFILNLESWLSG